MKIVMISMDTMRADRLGCYGYSLPTSPYIDGIAKDGVLFERAYAADIPTEVAHTDVFTGKLGLRTRVVSHGSGMSFLPKSEPWLPSLLKSYGMTTAAVDNMYQLKEWFARGYRHYINSSGSTRWIDGRTVNDLATSWIHNHKEEDFFLFIHYWDTHTPYLPDDKYVSLFYDKDQDPFERSKTGMRPAYNHVAYPFFKHHHYEMLGPVTDPKYINALYDAEVRYLDDLIRELDIFLEKEGIREETFLILFGDHGESLTEHDIFWDHCGLYESTVHVPLIVRWPGSISAGRRVSGLVQQVDLMPTILESLGIKLPEELDGKSLWPSIRGTADGTHKILFLSECAWQAARAVRTERYKLIRTIDPGPFVRSPVELYDLENDENETCNLAKCQSGMVQQLTEELETWVSDFLKGQEDPIQLVLRHEGLPFRKRIEKILLEQAGLSWDEWIRSPDKEFFDKCYRQQQNLKKTGISYT